MSTPRDVVLTHEQRAIKLATREAVSAAGGQVFVARELDRSQGRVSDWCSVNTPDFIPADLIRPLEALGAGAPGHPHITRALARAQGVTVQGDEPRPALRHDDLGDWLADLSREQAELVSALAGENLAGAVDSLSPAARDRLSREARELAARLAQFVSALEGGAAVRSVTSPARREPRDTS